MVNALAAARGAPLAVTGNESLDHKAGHRLVKRVLVRATADDRLRYTELEGVRHEQTWGLALRDERLHNWTREMLLRVVYS